MQSNKYKHGFTLVELLVTIAIIATLSTVGVLSYSSYIKKANRTKDLSMLEQCSIDLNAYCAANDLDIDSLSGLDIKTYLINNARSLIPSLDEYTYVYNKSTHKLEIKELEELKSSEGVSTDILELTQGYYVLGEGSSDIERALSAICYGDFNKVLSLSDDYLSYKTSISSLYSPSDSIFLTPTSVIKDNSLVKVKNVFLCLGMCFIPNVQELRELTYDDNVNVINKNIRCVVAGASDICDLLNVRVTNTIELTSLENDITILDKNDNNITNASIVNYQLGSEGIYDYLYDVNDPNNMDKRVSITFLNKNALEGKVFNKNDITLISVNYNKACSKAVSYSRVYTSASGTSLYKMSVIFYDNYNLIGYKEIYYVV